MIPKKDQETILKSLELYPNDTYTGEFYYHDVFDDDASYGDSRELAQMEAEKASIRKGKEVVADFTPENLKRLGAKSVYKKILYVKVRRHGAKDFKSYKATEQHKQQFPESWGLFEAQNNEQNSRNIREERSEIQPGASRPKNNTQSTGIGFTPSQYSTTFG